MNDWNPDKYLVYKNERTQPAIDLIEKIQLNNPKDIIDIGCGPGNSTQILVNKYPNCNIIGLDSSKTMIEKARTDFPNQIWIHENVENITNEEKYSLVFSNAVLQWIDNHEILIPKLWNLVDENGAFAAQIPNFNKMPINFAINNVLEKTKWSSCIKNVIWNKQFFGLDYYYELLSKYTDEIVLWETHYFHIMQSMQGIIDFVHSTALKPYLEQLSNEKKQEFEMEILEECNKYYRKQSNCKVLFPFERMFIIAYKR
jgi:trans-aconitate 2-methyltransferase